MTSTHTTRIWVEPDEALDLPSLLRARFPDYPEAAVVRRSVDARHRRVRVELWVDLEPEPGRGAAGEPDYPPLGSTRVIVVGAGPAGLFAAHALRLHGILPVVLEQGSGFPERHFEARSLRLWGQYASPAYTSGLGGAGTYSDGKLYTRKRTDSTKEVLRLLSAFGRDPELVVETHAHMGSNRLPVAIQRMVDRLSLSGAQFCFHKRVEALAVRSGRVVGVRTESGDSLEGDAVVLAPGNSARGLFFSLHAQGVALVAKPFAVGLRLEHPRALIDQIQYGRWAGHPALGAARYSFAFSKGNRGVYSFCMCPGGHLIPTPPEPGYLAVNGMSHSLRGSAFSNAAVVVSVQGDELLDWGSPPFQGIGFQRALEKQTFRLGEESYRAPAQRLVDFLARCLSSDLPASSYRPGLVPARLDLLLPPWIVEFLRWGVTEAEKGMQGYISPDALLVGTETLTSCPVQFPRTSDGESLSHPGLFPIGEGAGWGGGITSSAADGLEVGAAVARRLG